MFLSTRNWGMLKSSGIIVQTLTFFISVIITHLLPYPIDVDRSPAYWRPPTSRFIFHLRATPFQPFVPLANTFPRHCVISIRLQKCFKWLWSNFPQPNQNFHVYSISSTHMWTCCKRKSVNKSIWKKKCNCINKVVYSQDMAILF